MPDELSRAIEKAKRDISVEIELVRHHLSSTGDELRGQGRILKERVNWLIGQGDKIIGILSDIKKELERIQK